MCRVQGVGFFSGFYCAGGLGVSGSNFWGGGLESAVDDINPALP